MEAILQYTQLLHLLTISATCGGGGGSQNFTENGTFVVPNNVSNVRVVVVGGGGGGINGPQPGGGGGYINCSTIAVTAGHSIGVIVGAGGTGADPSYPSFVIVGNTDGGASSFGPYLIANGGSSCVFQNQNGCPGGTGSGASCNGQCRGSTTVGGTGGCGGNTGMGTPNATGGQGMGAAAYSACLNLPKLHSLTAGAGGAGRQPYPFQRYSLAAGGGGGGVLLDGSGPSAQNGR